MRDAVRALAAVVIPKARLVFGGHPSITPLVKLVVNRMDGNYQEHVLLYQSMFFEDQFPEENEAFDNVRRIERADSQNDSVEAMRNSLMKENKFVAGIFIGGMEGVLDEYELFRRYNPKGLILPVGSTGAASQLLYEKLKGKLDSRLATDFAYMALFRDLLVDFI